MKTSSEKYSIKFVEALGIVDRRIDKDTGESYVHKVIQAISFRDSEQDTMDALRHWKFFLSQ